MRKNFVFLLFVFFVIGCGQAEKEVKFQGVAEKNNFIEQGMEFLQQKDIAKAIQSFDQAIKMEPKNANNYIALGQVYIGLKNYSRAIDTLTAATNVGPMNGKAHYLLAVSRRLRNEEGDEKKALESTQRSIICFKKENNKEGFVDALKLLKSLTGGTQEEAPSEEK